MIPLIYGDLGGWLINVDCFSNIYVINNNQIPIISTLRLVIGENHL